MEEFIKLQRHDTALDFNRIGHMLFVMFILLCITMIDYYHDGAVGAMSLGAGFVAMIITLKCWRDIILLRQPDLNCWAFKP